MIIDRMRSRLGHEVAKLGFLRGRFHTILIWPIAGLLLTAVIWTATFFQIDQERQALLKSGVKEATSLSKDYAEQLSHSLEQIDQITLNLKYYWKNSGGTLKLDEQMHEGLYPTSALLYVSIVDRHGSIASSTLARKTNSDHANRDYFLAHEDNPSNELLISKPSIGFGSGKQVIRFSRRLNADDGSFDGLVMVSVEPAYFSAYDDGAQLGERGFLSLMSRDGTAMSTKAAESIRALPAAFNSPPSFESTTGVVTMGRGKFADHEARIVAWQAVKNYPLVSVVGLSEEDTLMPLQAIARDYRISAFMRTAAVLIFALIGMFLSSRLAWSKYKVEQMREAYGITTEGGREGFFMWRALRDRNGQIIDFVIVDCNESGASLYGMKKSALLGRRLSAIYDNRAHFQRLMQTYIHAMEVGFYEDDFPIPPESPLKMAWLHRKMMRSNVGLVLTLRDISERKAHEQVMSSLANSDALTALPNRHWLLGFLPSAIERARSSHTMLALIVVDIDDFKNINDTMGHAVGDELLQAVAIRLLSVIRSPDTVVRLGGDEFTLILEHPEDIAAIERISKRVIAVLEQPLLLAGKNRHVVTASIGISIYPKDGDSIETLLKHADIAMYTAKANGKAGYQFFQPQLSQNLVVRLNNEQALRAAIDNDEFELYYQPRVDAVSGELRSMEALLRWMHPQRGMVMPDEFIPMSEETGLIVALGELAIEKACSQLARWKAENLPLVPVSINVSLRQFNQGNLDQIFALHIKRHGIAPTLVEVELTESCMMEENHLASAQLAALKSLGLKLLIDDFGTGYSSLSQLQRLDLDILKVDKAFTSKLGKGKDGEVFFKAIISMAHVLNMSVVAEGVETLEQLCMLQALSCNEVQGYFVSEPLPAREMAQLMLKRYLFPSVESRSA